MKYDFAKSVAYVTTGVCVLGFGVSGLNAWAIDTMLPAEYLALHGVIEDQSEDPSKYAGEKSITRQEMLKIMINISPVELDEACVGKFLDLGATDWGCKYAETALANNFIAPNANFRPSDSVSKTEALKMIFQARGESIGTGSLDWRANYVQAGLTDGIFTQAWNDYDAPATRGWIFEMAHQTILKTLKNGDCSDKFNDDPTLTSLSSTRITLGSSFKLFGCNLAGFEGDKNAWIENSQGEKGILFGDMLSKEGEIDLELTSPLCQEDLSYKGGDCETPLELIPGTYTIFVNPWDKKSNALVFEITLDAPLKLSEAEAKDIAEKTCIKGGETVGIGSYNENSQTWWFDANLNATKPGCSPACVVSDATKTAEINWRCTGLQD